MNTHTQTIHSIYKQGLDTNKSSTQIIQLNYKHVLDKYERIEYIDNTNKHNKSTMRPIEQVLHDLTAQTQSKVTVILTGTVPIDHITTKVKC